jgi:hypothetical protein
VLLLFGLLAGCEQFALFSDLDRLLNGELRLVPSTLLIPFNGGYTFTAVGGVEPYDFRIESGNGTVVQTGRDTAFFSAPTAESLIVLAATDGNGARSTSRIQVTQSTSLTIEPPFLTLKTNDTYPFTAWGGVPPYTYSVLTPPPPDGGAIQPDTGLYTAPGAEASDVFVRVTDSVGSTRDAQLEIVETGFLGISPTNRNVAENRTFTFSAYGGAPPYSFSVVPADLGAVSSVTGLFTPLAPVGSTGHVRVQDNDGTIADAAVTIVPGRPGRFRADGAYGGPGELRLSWTDGSTTEEGFQIYERVGIGDWPPLGSPSYLVSTDVTSLVISGLVPNTPYTYRIRAYDGTLYSPFASSAFDIPNP